MRTKVFAALFSILVIAALGFGVISAQDDTIQWWHINTNEPELAFYQELADQFMADNPGVNIEITVLSNEDFKSRLTTVMQAGDPPDLFQSWGGGVLWNFADNGLVRDIAPELEGEWRDTIAAQAALELFGQNGEYYGVPVTWGAVGMFYNKDLFEQAGLDPENPPATWSEFLAAVQTLKDAGITPISLGEAEKWPGHFWWVYLAIQTCGQEGFLAAYTREGSFADECYVQAGQLLADLIALEPFPADFLGLSYGDQESIMGNGEAAMELMGQWSPGAQAGNSASGEGIGDALGWFPFPALEGAVGNPNDVLGGGDGFVVGANAPDATVDFLRFLISPENQRAAAAIWIVPVVNGVEDTYAENPITSAIINARNDAPYFQLYYDQFLPPAVGEAVNDAVETIFAGAASPEEAAAAIEEAASFELE